MLTNVWGTKKSPKRKVFEAASSLQEIWFVGLPCTNLHNLLQRIPFTVICSTWVIIVAPKNPNTKQKVCIHYPYRLLVAVKHPSTFYWLVKKRSTKKTFSTNACTTNDGFSIMTPYPNLYCTRIAVEIKCHCPCTNANERIVNMLVYSHMMVNSIVRCIGKTVQKSLNKRLHWYAAIICVCTKRNFCSPLDAFTNVEMADELSNRKFHRNVLRDSISNRISGM